MVIYANKIKKFNISNDMKKVCVIFGGQSSEHDISIITGMQLCKNFYSEKIEKIYFGLDNKFYLATQIFNLRCQIKFILV